MILVLQICPAFVIKTSTILELVSKSRRKVLEESSERVKGVRRLRLLAAVCKEEYSFLPRREKPLLAGKELKTKM